MPPPPDPTPASRDRALRAARTLSGAVAVAAVVGTGAVTAFVAYETAAEDRAGPPRPVDTGDEPDTTIGRPTPAAAVVGPVAPAPDGSGRALGATPMPDGPEPPDEAPEPPLSPVPAPGLDQAEPAPAPQPAETTPPTETDQTATPAAVPPAAPTPSPTAGATAATPSETPTPTAPAATSTTPPPVTTSGS